MPENPAPSDPAPGDSAPYGPGTDGGAPRTVLVTGQGGAGRTTVAAATALAAAREGRRTLLLSPEPDGRLESLLGIPVGHARAGSPVQAAPELWVARVAADEEFRERATALQRQARSALELVGAEPLDGEELTELPGADAFALLHALRTAHADAHGAGAGEQGTRGEDGAREEGVPEEGAWAVGARCTVVVDLPPMPRASAVLALPEQLRRYLRRLLPPERQAARALRPVLAQLAGVPMPAAQLYATAARWDAELAEVQRLVESPLTSVRFVAEPGGTATEALRTARCALALQGLRLEGAVANRLVPTRSSDTWTAALSGGQQEALKDWRRALEPDGVPVRELPHLAREPQGLADLSALADAGGLGAGPEPEPGPDTGSGPGSGSAPRPGSGPGVRRPLLGWVQDERAGSGLLLWRIPLPGAAQEEIGLVRRGDELVVDCGGHRRVLPLPAALRRCRGAGASLEHGELCVRFAPDPGLWPGGKLSGHDA